MENNIKFYIIELTITHREYFVMFYIIFFIVVVQYYKDCEMSFDMCNYNNFETVTPLTIKTI